MYLEMSSDCEGRVFNVSFGLIYSQSSYKTESQLQKLDEGINRGPNLEILLHEKKRKVELKCLEMQELMEEQG